METLSICYVSFSFYPSQGATAFYEYSRNMSEIGHRVTVVAAKKIGNQDRNILEKIRTVTIPVKNTKKISMQNPIFSFQAARVIKREIEHNRFDIIHVFSYAGSLLLKMRINRCKTKWIYDIRSGAVRGFFHLIPYFFNRIESHFFDAIFFIDEALPFNPSHKSFISPIGVNSKLFHPLESREILSRYGVKDQDIVYVYSGSLDRERRLKNLIHAFYKVAKTRKNLFLVIVGEGEDRKNLENCVKKIGMSSQIIFTGYVDYVKMPHYISAADVGISYVPITPQFNYQPPLKTLEYLACSIPVIATNTAGNQKYILPNENGVFVDDEETSISRAILKLAEDHRLRKRLTNNARKSAINHDWENIVRRNIIPSYNKILAS